MPKILNIITEPNKDLRSCSVEIKISEISKKEFQELISDMKHTMVKKDGVGLAAPQIGKNIRMVVVNTKNGPKCIINPLITKKSLLREWGEEGCLSVPNLFGDVKRHKKIKCEYYDEKGDFVSVTAEGMMARVFQHEIDHLDGVLFIDKAKNLKDISES